MYYIRIISMYIFVYICECIYYICIYFLQSRYNDNVRYFSKLYIYTCIYMLYMYILYMYINQNHNFKNLTNNIEIIG